MAGYANRVITLRFPELAEENDDIHVVIRNPKLMPAAELRALASSQTGADADRLAAARAIQEAGGEVPDDMVTEADADRGFAMVARMIIGWRVYDASSTETEQPLLPLPGTPELVGRLPQDILVRIMQEAGKANPQRSPEGSTSRTS